MSELEKLVAHAQQMCSEDAPFTQTAVAFQLDDNLYGAQVWYYPIYDKDGLPTGRRMLEVKVKRIDHPGELA